MVMTEGRMRDGLLRAILGNTSFDSSKVKKLFAKLDPLAQSRRPRPLRMADLKALFVPVKTAKEEP